MSKEKINSTSKPVPTSKPKNIISYSGTTMKKGGADSTQKLPKNLVK